MTAVNALFSGFDEAAGRVAFDFGEGDAGALTYGALWARASAWAAALRVRGVRPGDRVAVFAPSCPQLVVALVGHLRGGFVHVPINTRYRREEIEHILRDCGAAAVVAPRGSIAHEVAANVRGAGRRPAALDLDDPALSAASEPAPWAQAPPEASALAMLIYTSGTTGKSKGVALTHGALVANVGATTRLWRWTEGDVLALSLPLFHVHGLGLGVLGTLLHRMTALVAPRFDPAAVVAAFARRGATVFMGVPTMYHALLELLDADPAAAAALSGGRLFTSGSAALPASDHARFEAHTGQRILERYGMSETGFTLSNPYDGERRPGSVGFAVPGYEVAVLDDDGAPCAPGVHGEIHVRGDGLMRGYWGRAELTAAAFRGGWFQTGDVAFVDDDGYHHIVGRKSIDIIKSGGFKLSAREIEEVLLRDARVREAAVVGVPDPRWGERICAAVVLAPEAAAAADGADEATLLETFAAWVCEHLAAYKKPRALRVVEALPRNALGKVQKHRLKALFEG